ncbi:aminotransferase [Oscillospiraceae bacterium]|nr:aminotransferase [Oscillospiraceae bacterium]
MKLSNMANRIQPSLTRKLFDMASKYDDVIDFTLGDPDYETPEYIRKAGCDAINGGKTHYSANAGLKELREVISDRIYSEAGIKYDSLNEIQISVGAMEGIFLTLCCLVDPGDEVIIPSPHWVNYRHMTEMLNGNPVLVNVSEDNGFLLSPEAFQKAITDKTVAVILNSPNNPTGAVYDKDTLFELCRIAFEKDVLIIWDECYKSILFDGAKFVSILDFPDMKDHSVIVNSCSKRYSMTGWRVGYLAGPSWLISNMPKIQENIAACVPVPSQYAALAALSSSDEITDEMRAGFESRRNVLIRELNKIDKISVTPPKGTFYALVNIKNTGMKSEQFAYSLLENTHVAVVPGITYGDACEGYIRIAFTMNEAKIVEGVRRIKTFIDSL